MADETRPYRHYEDCANFRHRHALDWCDCAQKHAETGEPFPDASDQESQS